MTTANLLAHTFDGTTNKVQTKLCTGAVELNLAIDTHTEITPITKMLVQHFVSRRTQSLQSENGGKNERGPAKSKAENCLDHDVRSHQKQL